MNTALLSVSVGWALVSPPVEANALPSTDAPAEVTPGNESAPPSDTEVRGLSDSAPSAESAEPAEPADLAEPAEPPVLTEPPRTMLGRDLACD